MKIKEYLNKRFRLARFASVSGIILFAIGLFLIEKSSKEFIVLALVGFVIGAGGVLYQLIGIKCPRCHKAIGDTLDKKSTKFCKSCGASLDDEL